MLVRILILLFVSLTYSYGSIIMTDDTKLKTGFSLSYLYDDSSKLDIHEIIEQNFTQTIPSQFALGYKEGAAWFKLTIENRSRNTDFVLYFTEPFWADFNLFEPTPSGWTLHRNGLLTPLEERGIEDASPAFSLHINSGETKTYYIQGHTVNSQIGSFQLYTEKEFFRPSRLTLNTFYLFYAGILFIIIVINLFLLLEMRERIYAYYIGYVSSFIVFVAMFSGSYLYFGFSGWNEGLHTIGTLVLAFMALFSATFLQLEQYFPKIDQLFKFITAIFLIMGVMISQDTPNVTFIFNILSSIFVAVLLILAIKTWLLGKIETRFYLIALIIYMPTMGMMVLTFNAVLENTDFTRYSFLFGALVEIIFFSLILASRFHTAKYDKIHFQKELLAEKKKNMKLLENEIAKQRLEIKEKNAILFHQSRHAAMGEMISMIAHQWRQPLNTLALINQNLYITHKLGKCDDKTFEESHHQFNEHLQYMSKTIDDFRNYYKNDTMKHSEEIGEIIQLALRLSDVFLNYAKITTEVTVATKRKIYVAKNEMIQVLMNLIKNAHDAIVERHVHAGNITIRAEETATAVCIHICDNGGGVPEEISDKIFEPDFSTKAENGTGLGLYMSKSIVEEHCGGSLFFHNTKSGACFTIALPLSEEVSSDPNTMNS